MIRHPSLIHVVADLHRQEVLAQVAHERRVRTCPASAPQRGPLAARVLALVVLALGLRA